MPTAEKIETSTVIVEPVAKPEPAKTDAVVDPKDKKPEVVETKDKTPAKDKPAKTEEDASDDDDVEPDDKGMVTMPKKAFMKKVSSMSNKELKRIFGTTDVDKILAERKELEDLRASKTAADAKAEETRRATLKEEERLKEDNAKLQKANQELQAALASKDEEVLVDRQENYLQAVVTKVVDEDSVDYALSKFRKHVRGLSNHAVEQMTEKDVKGWFDEWAKEHPKHARGAAEEKKEPKKVALTTGAKKPESKPAEGKSGQPVQKKPMEMSKSELAAYKRERGISY